MTVAVADRSISGRQGEHLSVGQGPPWRRTGSLRLSPSDGVHIFLNIGQTVQMRDVVSGTRGKISVPGTICLTPAEVDRKVRVEPLGSFARGGCITLPSELLSRHVEERGIRGTVDNADFDLMVEPDPVLQSVFPHLLERAEGQDGELYLQSAAQFLAAHLVSRMRVPDQAPTSSLGKEQMSRITAYMHAHLAEDVQLDDLAALVSLSRFHFIRVFKAAAGQTPYQYLTRLRLQHACEVLRAGDKPVRQISRLCGFGTPESFAKAFRRHMGCTPTQYRAGA